ncbi:MAG: GNAT family N-acetyltransferase [Candidatus Bipolaricaulis sp.]|nr:GNAT family N-acetyltransferase [Candidatus Bipolaricaulis sp.]
MARLLSGGPRTHGTSRGSVPLAPRLPRPDDSRIVATIRVYEEETDARAVGRLIADTFGRYNLSHFPPVERDLFLGPFRHATSDDPAHRAEIARMIRSEIVLVADDAGEIVGVLRGRAERLGSLFVRGDRHRGGIGRALVEWFEKLAWLQGGRRVHVAATPYAVPFYLAVGYKRSTGARRMKVFEGSNYLYQPMKKVLAPTGDGSELGASACARAQAARR